MALMDDVHKFVGADLIEFPVGLAIDGDGQRGNGKTGFPGLLGGVEGGGVGYDMYHDSFSFLPVYLRKPHLRRHESRTMGLY